MSNLKKKDQQYIWHPFDQMKGANVVPIVKGKGAYVFDENGKRYIDAFSSWWVNIHGHSHPYLVNALYEQAQQLEHVAFGGFTHEKAVTFSEKLLKLLPAEFSKVFFSDNGSTATEVGLKMALQLHHNLGKERTTFIALENGYHGDTFGSMSVTARGGFNEPFEKLLFDVVYIPAPTQENIQFVLEKVAKIIQSRKVAGFIFEPLIQGAGGMLTHDANALSEIIKLCKQNDVVTIADEVMTGFGRTGKMFACEFLTEQPEIICLSKGITGGFMAMGATVVTNKIYQAFYSDQPKHTFLHGHSYTGNALACALAVANLELFEKENTLNEVQRIEKKLLKFKLKIENNHSIRAVRHIGAILAIELATQEATSYFNTKGKDAYAYFLEKGIILRPLGNVLVLIPPFCISDEDLDFIFDAIEAYIS